MKMTRKCATLGALIVLLLPAAALAGEVKGSVEVHGIRSAENIVVYVDAIAGKTFEAPAQQPVINQIKMTFQPLSVGGEVKMEIPVNIIRSRSSAIRGGKP
jgi:hypothetical protein